MAKYRFQENFDDEKINNLQRQIEDSFATSTDLDVKADVVKDIFMAAPVNKDLVDGQTCLYDDGTNVFRYWKAGGRLFKQQLTEVL